MNTATELESSDVDAHCKQLPRQLITLLNRNYGNTLETWFQSVGLVSSFMVICILLISKGIKCSIVFAYCRFKQ
jgi:hypothetical protein